MWTILRKNHLPLIIALAVIFRLAILLLFPGVFAFDQTGAIHGSDAYDKYAINLSQNGVYGLDYGLPREPAAPFLDFRMADVYGIPDAAIPPLYGYLLSGVYGVFGRGYIQVGLLHILLDALSIWMVYGIARRLFKRDNDNHVLFGFPRADLIATLAGLFYAFYPYLIFQNLTLIDTPLFMTLLHAFVLLVVLLRERDSLDRGTWLLAITAGVMLGLSTLVRPITPLLAIMVALWFLFRLNFWQTVIRLLPVAVFSAVMLVPWIARNYTEFDAFIPMTTTSGANLWQGNSKWTIPVFRAGYDVQWTSPNDIPSSFRDREADAQRFAQAIDFWRDNPDKLPELLWVKFLVHWSIDIAPRYNPQPGETFMLNDAGNLQIVQGDTITGVNEANAAYDEPLFDLVGRWIHRFYFGGLLLLAIAGVWLSRKAWREVSLLWFVQISMTLIYIIFHPSTRYRAPTDPMLFIFSAVAVVWLLAWWQARRRFA